MLKNMVQYKRVPPQVKCLANKPTFECHPSYKKVFNKIIEKI